MDVRDAEAWQLVDRRLDEVRRLPHADLLARAAGEPEVEIVERPSGSFCRRTRVLALPHERLGISVRVDTGGRRARAEGGIVITPDGAIAPEWSRKDDPPRGNPFAVGPRVTIAGVLLCVLLMALFLLLA